ncbi:Glutathione-dependent formaldehyde-activating enzyme [Methyloligella halotolerans]|uniref:Glutathione-dependent formaldehyde-activating enzyme n=1 Tax=Methyloligella halotolerans TaxID=1177755 RepID=A0A1E2RWR3_9HYPH|nr:GFA family protein [Methyloligella halotolerans]ODA66509.1 Glutathione-dependent formaldehyde-activating enzyme [Methyloligella halotolerans]
MPFEGSCHCGAVTFSVDADAPTSAKSCNCSHCRRKGFLWAFFPREVFGLKSGEDVLTSYGFGRRIIDHVFCSRCGTQAFALGTAPGGAETAAINLRCVPDIDLDALKIERVDGARY